MNEIIQTSVMITVFVMLMMLIIEYINIKTRGNWSRPLKKNKWLQIIIAALLGAIPGCIGVYTVVSLFTHKILSFGALVSAMIATSGDEAFVLFAMMPEKALWLTIIIFVLAIVVGFLSNLIFKNVEFSKSQDHDFHVHKEEPKCNNKTSIIDNFRTLSFTRSLILTGLIIFLINLFIGQDHHNHSFSVNEDVFSAPAIEHQDIACNHEDHQHTGSLQLDRFLEETSSQEHNHSHEQVSESHDSHLHAEGEHQESELNLPKIIFILLTVFALFIIVIVPNHFIEEHAWNHVIKKHFLKIFLWTFSTLLLIYLLKNYFDIDINQLVKDNLWLVLIIAILIGIIPESGPHMVFISLFVSGAIPFSILIVNSIVQDGHGSLPLFAENKKAFLYMKLVNVTVGALVGVAGLLFAF